MNMKAMFAVMNTTWAVVKIRPEKIQACTRFEPMTPAIPVQCSTNWANKPTGSWLICCLNVNIWKSYMWTADNWDLNMKAIFAVMNTTWALVQIRVTGLKKKFQACTEFESMIFAISVQCSSSWTDEPTESWSLSRSLINPLSDKSRTVKMWIHVCPLRF